MPFQSEKQRRFLWAKHPELAKRWAHEYPESNKNLPMYAKDTAKKPASDQPVSKAAALSSLRTALVNNCAEVNKCSCLQASGANSKTADSKLTHIQLPQAEKPTYAGERQIQSILKPDSEDEGGIGEARTVNKQQNVTNPLLSKLAVVLAPKIQQEIEDAKAQAQARMAQRVPNNVNVKQYPVNTPTIPPPMGMAQAPQAPQQPAQPQAQPQNGQLASVGGGSSPNASPINSFGGLSSTGDINGNAALGTQNGVGGEKLATQKCSCGCGQTVADCSCPVSCSCRQKGGSCYGKKTAAPKQASQAHPHFDISALLQQLSPSDEFSPEEFTDTLEPVKPQDPNMAAIAAILGTSGTMEYLSGKNRRRNVMKFASAGDPIQIWLTGMDHIDNQDMLDILAEERMLKAAVEKWAGSPAWQRSAGKNPEGGLNAKGRASYKAQTGGTLKAPVTESNPSGERAKRQNSFCSRMCGMKRVNTGAETKSDPDSRINKSLRKWNCKCGSALEFGTKLAYDIGNRRQSTNVVDMRTTPPSQFGRMLGFQQQHTAEFPKTVPELEQTAREITDAGITHANAGQLINNRHTQALERSITGMDNVARPEPTVQQYVNKLENTDRISAGKQPKYFDGRPAAVRQQRPSGLPISNNASVALPGTIAGAVQGAVKRYQAPLPGKK